MIVSGSRSASSSDDRPVPLEGLAEVAVERIAQIHLKYCTTIGSPSP